MDILHRHLHIIHNLRNKTLKHALALPRLRSITSSEILPRGSQDFGILEPLLLRGLRTGFVLG